MLWFIGKVWVFMFVFIWLRGTLPRLRYDQFMRLGWKVLIPLSLLWIVVVATVRALANEVELDRQQVLIWGGGAIVVLVALSMLWDALSGRGRAAPPPDGGPPEFDPFAGGYPVPPLPGQQVPGERKTIAADRATSDEGTETVDV
jgi:NADH-quinone oxidoreductase subunit H